MPIKSRRSWPMSLAVVAVCLTLGSAHARAQFGYGGGGFYNFNYRPPEVDYLNQKSLLNASQATMGPVQNNVYANNPNAYINQLHAEGFLDKYDVGTRRSIEASIGRYSDGPPPDREPRPAPATTSAPAPARAPQPLPGYPLASFFDRYQKLVWPDESPTYGQLGAKREVSDQACLDVFKEYKLRGLAQIGKVTEARAKLLDYGRPALQYVRDNATPRVADTFHMFLLSLYESLARAATVPGPAQAPALSPPTPPANAASPTPRP